MLNVPVVMLVAAAAVLIGVIYVATGRGGELTFFQPDYAPLKMDQVTSTDVALFRPPSALWGYSMQATDEALNRIAGAITERDVEISALQQQVADLQAAAAQRHAYSAPQTPGGRDELPSGRAEPFTRPPEPGALGSARPQPDTPGSGRPRPDTPTSAPDVPGSRPDVPGSRPDDPDIVLPERLPAPDEPRQPGRPGPDDPSGAERGDLSGTGHDEPNGTGREEPSRAEHDEPSGDGQPAPASADQNGLENPDTRPVTQGSRPGAAGPEPGGSAVHPSVHWFGRAADRTPFPPGWAALPKRPPAGAEGEDSP